MPKKKKNELTYFGLQKKAVIDASILMLSVGAITAYGFLVATVNDQRPDVATLLLATPFILLMPVFAYFACKELP